MGERSIALRGFREAVAIRVDRVVTQMCESLIAVAQCVVVRVNEPGADVLGIPACRGHSRDTPCTYASITTAYRAWSIRRRSSSTDGKNDPARSFGIDMRARHGHRFPELGFSSTVRLDGYSDWVRGEDFGGAYARFRSALQVLDGDDGRLWS
jgi:hypothetical protein